MSGLVRDQPSQQFSRHAITLGMLAELSARKMCVTSPWYRNERWRAKDRTNFITALLRNTTPMTTIYLAARPAGEGYFIVDGQNRIAAVRDFIDNKVNVRAGDVFSGAEHLNNAITFAHLATAQQQSVRNIQFEVCEFPETCSEEFLREVYANLNRVKPLSMAERIHSWHHLSLVREVLNPLDEQFAERAQRCRPRWRARNHSMIVLYAKIVAAISDTAPEHLTTPAVEAFVAKSARNGYCQADFDRAFAVIAGTFAAFELSGCDFEKFLFLDTAWALHVFNLIGTARGNELAEEIMAYMANRRAAEPDSVWCAKQPDNMGAALIRRDQLRDFLESRGATFSRQREMVLRTEESGCAVGFASAGDDEDDDDDEDDVPSAGGVTASGIHLWAL